MRAFQSFFQRFFSVTRLAKVGVKVRALVLGNPLSSALVFLFCTWMSISLLVLNCESLTQGHNIESIEDAMWWGFVTLSTVGYGDKYPVSTQGRGLAILLILCGVIAIAIVTAKISSFFLERALRERRGVVDSESLKNHFVICGWKDEMADFLTHFLDGNPHIQPQDIVLVTAAPEADLEILHEITRFKRLQFVRGEHYLEVNLRRAAPERASKILILADATPGPNGQIPTITEADARTIMTAMALNNFARGVPVAAEIIDSSMDQYLRLAHVNEIIYSREHSRLLLAMASGGVGVINVFHDLLNPANPSFLMTKPMPKEFVGKTVGDLQHHFLSNRPNETFVGLLENSGNSYAAKEAALKRAQQTPNVEELVRNLHGVKTLKFNHPIFNPSKDLVITAGMMTIVVENRNDGRYSDKQNKNEVSGGFNG